MWVFLNNAFFSAVVDRSDKTGRTLVVRGRRKGELQKVFRDVKVETTPLADYRFRARVSRDELAAALAREVGRINYVNFKDSVDDKPRHDAYLRVWSAMFSYQKQHEPKPKKRGRSALFARWAEDNGFEPLPGYEPLDAPDRATGDDGYRRLGWSEVR